MTNNAIQRSIAKTLRRTSAAVCIGLIVISTSAQAQPGIDPLKCSDGVGPAQKLLIEQIVLSARTALSSGLKPAFNYERDNDRAYTVHQRVDIRAEHQANQIAKAVFAGVAAAQRNPASSVGDAASVSIHGDAKRRAAVEMFNTCRAGEKPLRVINNNVYQAHPEDCFTSTSMGLTTSQVYQTKRPAEAVRTAITRSMVMNPDVTVCDSKECHRAGKHTRRNPALFNPKSNNGYYFRTKTQIAMSAMVNDQVMKVTEVSICGTKAFLVTSYGNGHSQGFSRASAITLIAPVGNQTLVVGSSALQASEDSRASGTALPLRAAKSQWMHKTPEMLFGIFNKVGERIGSVEHAPLGKIGASAQFQAGIARAVQRRSVE